MLSHAQTVDSLDPKDRIVVQVFDRLCRSILESGDTASAAQRLWLVPDVAARFVHGVATDEDARRVAPVVHRLRRDVAHIINQRLDRTAARTAIARRIAAARAAFAFRPWRMSDATRYATLLGDQAVWDALPDEYPGAMTEPMARDLIEISNGWSERHVVYAVEWRGQAIGQVRLQFDSSVFANDAEISYWLGTPYWGQGLGTSIVTLFTADSFHRKPELERIFAVVLDGNVPSTRLLEKAGYRYESFRYLNVLKGGSKRSSLVFGLSRADYEKLDQSFT
jgi:RimJ/RimL family protein N-acetyltransferase